MTSWLAEIVQVFLIQRLAAFSGLAGLEKDFQLHPEQNPMMF